MKKTEGEINALLEPIHFSKKIHLNGNDEDDQKTIENEMERTCELFKIHTNEKGNIV